VTARQRGGGEQRSERRPTPILDSAAVIAQVLQQTGSDVAAKQEAARDTGRRFKMDLSFAISFAKHMSAAIADGLREHFPTVKSGENPSRAVAGIKRVDVNYSTPEAGLGLAISLKSVHFGERNEGTAGFTHNMKRNDEELRVEATGHHIRQPYAVLVALLFLPFESCEDLAPTSSFASWVQYLWPLKGRTEPEDPPDRFELVFVALYARGGSALGFYRLGGDVKCPRHGRPDTLLTFQQFLQIIRSTYDKRNGKDFAFEGEEPTD
jgi:hypothetical protein